MDDAAYNIGSIGLQKDSEFLEVLNYYLLKEMESGLWWREYQEYHKHLHVNQHNFGGDREDATNLEPTLTNYLETEEDQ